MPTITYKPPPRGIFTYLGLLVIGALGIYRASDHVASTDLLVLPACGVWLAIGVGGLIHLWRRRGRSTQERLLS